MANGARFMQNFIDGLPPVWGVFLMIPAMRHPEVPDEPRLNEGRLLLGAVGLIVSRLTFSLTPFHDSSLMSFFHFDPFKTAPYRRVRKRKPWQLR
ncbi:MAG TPA: hypothetical protein VGG85_09695 [Terracidiphilus sp.]